MVARSILEGVKDGVQGANLQYIKTIRIILLKINVFLEFKAMAQQIFGGNTQLIGEDKSVPCRGNNIFLLNMSMHLNKYILVFVNVFTVFYSETTSMIRIHFWLIMIIFTNEHYFYEF